MPTESAPLFTYRDVSLAGCVWEQSVSQKQVVRHSRRILMSKRKERLFQDYQRQNVILGLDLNNR